MSMLSRRDAPLTRTQKLAQRARRMRKMAESVQGRPAVMGGSTAGPVPKVKPLRSQALRDMAEGRPCMFLVPAICNARTDTTVLCHENQGKGTGTKQSDERAAWGCVACHDWYDRSGAPREQKRAVFMGAHSRQVLAYRVVATDASEPERFRKAALLVLERVGATPMAREMR